MKESFNNSWQEQSHNLIKNSDGVIVIINKKLHNSDKQKWEISCAQEDLKKILGIWSGKYDRTNINGIDISLWSWETIKDFINSL